MSRRSILTAFVVAILLATPMPAHASFWDWMQEWSGPGPFDSGGNVAATFCFGDFLPGKKKIPCAYMDARQLVAEKNDNFPIDVTANVFDMGVSWRLRQSIELGFGAGVTSAMGAARTSKFTVTAPRVVIKPLVIISDLARREPVLLNKAGSKFVAARILHSLKFYYRVSVMFGTLDAEDLGVGPSQSSFTVNNDIVQSRGFLIDLGELFGKYK